MYKQSFVPGFPEGAQRIGAALSILKHDARVTYFVGADNYIDHPVGRSAVKLDLYGYKFYVEHVLRQPWAMPWLIRPPKVSRLPDIVTVEQAQVLFSATRILSYRVFFFTLYSLGLRLSEGLALSVADIDAERARVQIRDSKGNRDRFVPLPAATLVVLRRFWQKHRNPEPIRRALIPAFSQREECQKRQRSSASCLFFPHPFWLTSAGCPQRSAGTQTAGRLSFA